MNETQCRRLVRERSGGTCEIRNLNVCQTRTTNASHRKPRSQGGTWTPSNILDACGSGTTGCHGWVEHNPQEALRYGFRVQRHDTPTTVPVLHARHGWTHLHDDGSHTPLIRDRAYSEPEGWADRATYTDDTLPHQIRITGIGSTLYVGCTCNTWKRELTTTHEIANATTIHHTEHLKPPVPPQRAQA